MKTDLKQFDRFAQEIYNRIILETKDVDTLIFEGNFIDTDTYLGSYDTTFDVYGNIEIPGHWDDYILEVHSDAEGSDSAVNPQYKLIIDDALIGTYDINHKWVFLKRTQDMLAFTLNIYTGNTHKKFPIKVRAIKISPNTLSYYHDLIIFKDALRNLDRNDLQFYRIYDGLIQSLKVIDANAKRDVFETQIIEAQAIVETIYDDKESYKPTVHAVGHTHIDIAWLWTVEQAISKAERSFTTILNYMDQYKDFKFIQSQPQLYEFIEEKNPKLFERIQQAIQKGQWEPEGSMWVESDTTLVSGESLVRQLLYGKQYFKDKFNNDNKILWLPDVFGYSASLPQLLKQANIPYFMSTKLSWNEFNKIPYDTFNWVGIDGSEVLTHFIPTPGTDYKPRPWYTTYNGFLDVPSVKGAWERYQQKNLNAEILNAFGFGDGGGGPTDKMLEAGTRLQKGVPGIPNVKFDSALNFFETIKRNTQDKDLPSWHGELYFEFHRGTYTTRAINKLKNRRLEFALQNIEKLSVLLNKKDDDILKSLWKRLLLNQFHDILPGTSIKDVYDVTEEDYAWIEDELERIEGYLFKEGDSAYLYNPTGIKHTAYLSGDFKEVPLQAKVQYDVYGKQLLQIDTSGDYLEKIETKSIDKQVFHEEDALKTYETKFFKLAFNDAYEITSLFDKEAKREVVCEHGALNVLNLYEDLPSEYDAWDIDVYHDYKKWHIENISSSKLISDGDLAYIIELKREFFNSSITQTLIIYKNERRIDVKNHIDWHEKGKLLKVAFDVDISANEATYDVQYGTIKRQNHNNTSWEVAQFEVNAQKWADLSEGNYGFSLINDSKYGYATDQNYMSMSLLRSPSEPYENIDEGIHEFTYSIMPHTKQWQDANIMEKSLTFNNPVQLKLNKQTLSQEFDVKLNSDHVQIDTIKHSEDGSGFIMRLYEFKNQKDIITLNFNNPLKSVHKVSILEEHIQTINPIDNQVTFEIKPYEVITIKVENT